MKTNKLFVIISFLVVLIIIFLFSVSNSKKPGNSFPPIPSPYPTVALQSITPKISQIDSNQVSEKNIDICEQDDDCIVVPHVSCCFSEGRAINKKYKTLYDSHQDWHGEIDANECAKVDCFNMPEEYIITICKSITSIERRCEIDYKKPR